MGEVERTWKIIQGSGSGDLVSTFMMRIAGVTMWLSEIRKYSYMTLQPERGKRNFMGV